jgi:nicotinic acid phosphoribosyltransferase
VQHGWSADNLAFGSGGAGWHGAEHAYRTVPWIWGAAGSLLQKLNRDTQKCAYKCSYVEVAGVSRVVFKDPITDKGKLSKKGRLALVERDGSWSTLTECQSDVPEVGNRAVLHLGLEGVGVGVGVGVVPLATGALGVSCRTA